MLLLVDTQTLIHAQCECVCVCACVIQPGRPVWGSCVKSCMLPQDCTFSVKLWGLIWIKNKGGHVELHGCGKIIIMLLQALHAVMLFTEQIRSWVGTEGTSEVVFLGEKFDWCLKICNDSYNCWQSCLSSFTPCKHTCTNMHSKWWEAAATRATSETINHQPTNASPVGVIAQFSAL